MFALGACSCGCLRALVLAQVCWGWWDSVVPPPLCPGLLACLRAHAFGVGLLACAGYCAAGATVMGRDMIVPPHTAWRCPRCVACKRRVGALSWCANTRARAERDEGEGRLVGRTVVDWLGAWRFPLGGGVGWW